jgi:hypothetical protein
LSSKPCARRERLLLALLLIACFFLCSCRGTDDSPNFTVETFTVYDESKSSARNWNEALLSAIRLDLARPTVHARNLFHSSALMYDVWAVYDDSADTFFLGKSVGGFTCEFSTEQRAQLRSASLDVEADRNKAIAYGMYRLLSHRFAASPGAIASLERFNALIKAQGYDETFSSRDFSRGSAAALGLYLADCVIDFGMQDGSNEANGYRDFSYQPVNLAFDPVDPGAAGLIDPNRWQPLDLAVSIDQSGNALGSQQSFLSAEWGQVVSFSLSPDDLVLYERDGFFYPVYHDPGMPALLRGADSMPQEYQWTHSLVALWSSHLDPDDGVVWDISPGTIGNTEGLPITIPAMREFFNALDGGVRERGHALNPHTGAPYEAQLVPRGDYTRVLAEFWADGPDSETPPGHWFTIANQAVNDHPEFERRYQGHGEALPELEWDVKLYFTLGAAMHDAAIAAWGAKGWYDYIRPISAIRFMATQGQSSDPSLPTYHPEGLPLVEGRIALVEEGDELAGEGSEHVGKIKLFVWRGPGFIRDSRRDTAGVGWILAENWWPYQRPTFVTPPFAGYVSGHSTFSRAAAEVLSSLTGDEFFPGGMAQFVARKDDFLVFERGPSVDVVLQWATFRDASDQTSLSRIWGGIHPPVDDIPGRLLGIRVASGVLQRTDRYFRGTSE